MTRGNQRDLARAKAQKKLEKVGGKKVEDGLTHQQRKERDAELMRKKQELAKQAKGVVA
ncbi:hypothetical protein GGH94_000363 [Coemansia aciculifera]|uniref:Small EDRK-rich factor-like N-terminal domain-containing protein n=1 Tax=Coemansia aciculifera TaxID=417176 RepID=A0A9W8IWR2_9FUNG|nr:hypothetical protein GGH94_000363 [Coemansia aciculifera]KAJ2874918.1 hypothetical protein GGH93_002046 [Coemansia aciculifera]